MDRTVARMNIGRFRKLLAEERDSRKRETIRLLLEEEERKLAAQTQGHQGGGLLSLSPKAESDVTHTAGGENGFVARGSDCSARYAALCIESPCSDRRTRTLMATRSHYDAREWTTDKDRPSWTC